MKKKILITLIVVLVLAVIIFLASKFMNVKDTQEDQKNINEYVIFMIQKNYPKNELELAYKKFEVTDADYEIAYKEARELMKRLENKKNELKEFTDKYLYKMMNQN